MWGFTQTSMWPCAASLTQTAVCHKDPWCIQILLSTLHIHSVTITCEVPQNIGVFVWMDWRIDGRTDGWIKSLEKCLLLPCCSNTEHPLDGSSTKWRDKQTRVESKALLFSWFLISFFLNCQHLKKLVIVKFPSWMQLWKTIYSLSR